MVSIARLDAPLAPAEPGPAAATDADRARAAAEKFEAHFIAETLHRMRRSARELGGDDALFRDRAGDDMLEMADSMVADALAGRHAFGIADVLLRQLLPAPALHAPAAAVALDQEPTPPTPPRRP